MPKGVKQEPTSRPQQVTLDTPKAVSHIPIGHLISEFGGKAFVAKFLHVDPDLVNRWSSHELEPPYSVRLALFWLGTRGFTEAFNQSHWTHQFNSFLKNEARNRVEMLEAFITAAGLPMPPGRLTSSAEMLLAGPTDWLKGEAVNYRKQLVAKVAAMHAADATKEQKRLARSA